jgi:uncharacterized protein (TIGR03437 family)
VDSAGNLYIADRGPTDRIRKVSPQGIITTVAGGGTVYPGDGGPAASVRLGDVYGLAADLAGNIYFADWSNDRVHKITPTGIITTFAGNGTCCSGNGGDGGPATQAQVSSPTDVAVDEAGNVYISSSYGPKVRKVSSGGIITTIAGNGTYGFSGDGGPATNAQTGALFGVSIDATGNIYIPDALRLRKVSSDGIINTIAGNGTSSYSGDGGPAIDAQFTSIAAAAGDRAGNIYIVDGVSNAVRRLQPIGASASLNALANAASFGNQPQAAGSIVSLFGTGLASSTASAVTLPLPTSLAGVTVRVNGIAAPLFFVSPFQINLQIPWEVSGQSPVSLTVTSDIGVGVTSINFAGSAPGIFSLNQAGTGQGAIPIASTGEFAAPVGSVPGRASRPARRGEFVTIYCTGLGAVANRPFSGAAATDNPLSTTTTIPTVSFGGVPVPVTQGFFSGLAPGFVGLYQVNVQVPQSAPTGNAVPVTLSMGGTTSNTVTVALE